MKLFSDGLSIAIVILLAVPILASARLPWTDSPLPVESQVSLEKALKLMKAGKFERAEPLIASELERANDIPKCLAIAAFSEAYGAPLMQIRRQCLQKALSLCQTRQDFIQVALKSRQYQFFEITRQAINSLIQSASNVADLYDLARKSQEVALNDVAHMAMERAFTGLKSVPEALRLASECKAMGMEDLVRKVYKALIDDENSAHHLCAMLPQLEPLGQPDLNRALLKKALEQATNVDELWETFQAAKRLREQDIAQVAEYRGKKLTVIQRIKHDREEYQKQLQAWREGLQQDLAKQQDEADKSSQQSTSAAGAGSAAQPQPGSGF